MTDKALVPVKMNLSETLTLGETLARSGFFPDTKQAAQAVVKVLAGQELGFGPIASMTGINIVQNRVALSANLIAAAVKRSGVYNYRIREHSPDGCTIEFFENGTSVGLSIFTMADAKAANLTGTNWQKYPRNMLFARAISNGAKWFCPDIFGGPVYTPDELGAEVDGETGDMIIDATPVTSMVTENTSTVSDATHWIDKTTRTGTKIRTKFWAWAKDEMGLGEIDVYKALGVEHIHDYAGSMDDAKTSINDYIAARIEAEAEQAQMELAA